MIIIGLGNPDKQYQNTYHNVGFMAVDRLAELLDCKFKTKECKSLTATAFINGSKVIIAKPQTYMNLSGEAVIELIGKYKASPQDVVVIYDDIDLPVAALRVRKEGSGGTHNGMKNIVELLSTKNISRVRVGIGKPPENVPLISYVLARISGENLISINAAVDKLACCLRDYIACSSGDIDKLMRDIASNND